MLLKLAADLRQLSRIREFVVDSATTLGVDPAAFDDLRLAVDEAVTNVLTHGYDGSGDIELEIRADGSDLVIRLRDQAPPFDPAMSAPIDLSSREDREKPGGFGMFLMKRAMDKLVHSELKNGNELTMTKCNVVSDFGAPDLL